MNPTETPPLTLYGTQFCVFCAMARELLERKSVSYEDLDVNRDSELRKLMEQRSQRRTVPQLFIGDRHIGGYEELSALDSSGELDKLLGIHTTVQD